MHAGKRATRGTPNYVNRIILDDVIDQAMEISTDIPFGFFAGHFHQAVRRDFWCLCFAWASRGARWRAGGLAGRPHRQGTSLS